VKSNNILKELIKRERSQLHTCLEAYTYTASVAAERKLLGKKNRSEMRVINNRGKHRKKPKGIKKQRDRER
jgi:hypothetical protein